MIATSSKLYIELTPTLSSNVSVCENVNLLRLPQKDELEKKAPHTSTMLFPTLSKLFINVRPR
jgi:hypothetical protein